MPFLGGPLKGLNGRGYIPWPFGFAFLAFSGDRYTSSNLPCFFSQIVGLGKNTQMGGWKLFAEFELLMALPSCLESFLGFSGVLLLPL